MGEARAEASMASTVARLPQSMAGRAEWVPPAFSQRLEVSPSNIVLEIARKMTCSDQQSRKRGDRRLRGTGAEPL
jgi:hypothetical protein